MDSLLMASISFVVSHANLLLTVTSISSFVFHVNLNNNYIRINGLNNLYLHMKIIP